MPFVSEKTGMCVDVWYRVLFGKRRLSKPSRHSTTKWIWLVGSGSADHLFISSAMATMFSTVMPFMASRRS